MSKDDKIGALWVNEKNDNKYLTGEVNGEKVVIFKNGYKKNDTHPDWIVYKSKPKGKPSIKDLPDEVSDIEPF